MSAKEILDHHLEAFGNGDAKEIVKEYSEESVLLTPDGTIRGLEALEAAFQSFFEGMFKPGTFDFSLTRTEVAGDVAYIVWSAKTSAGHVPIGTDTLVVRDGKIAVHTVAMHLVPE